MAGTADGRKAVTIQVKTKNKAFSRASKKEPAEWYWQIDAKAKEFRGKSVFYAFVDLKEGTGDTPILPMPDVFIVPADLVAEKMNHALAGATKDDGAHCWVSVYGEPPSNFFFHIEAGEDQKEKDGEIKWGEAWHLIEDALKAE
jgi:hypothetical protein